MYSNPNTKLKIQPLYSNTILPEPTLTIKCLMNTGLDLNIFWHYSPGRNSENVLSHSRLDILWYPS